MILKGYVVEDFSNYKIPSLTLAFPNCTFKCGKDLCQNSTLFLSENKNYDIHELLDIYINNKICKCVVFGGMEPMDSFDDVIEFITKFREQTSDDIIIYTGYNKEELLKELDILKKFTNIVIKFGRFIPNDTPHFDSILGVNLASNNQYAEKIN